MLCLSLAIFEACSVPFFLLVDADLADFDPRPAVRRVLNTDAGARAVVAVFNAKADAAELAADARIFARLSLREAAVTAAALLALLTITPGATR